MRKQPAMRTSRPPIPHVPVVSRRGGFTLVEVMVAVAIAAVLLGIAAPSFRDATVGMRATSIANTMVGTIIQARSEAIKRNAAVTLCASTNGTSCNGTDWSQGWIVMCNVSSTEPTICNSAGSSTLVMSYQQAISTGWKITEASPIYTVQFQPTGMSSTSATFTVCRYSPSAGAQEREVRISGGRPSVKTTTTGSCT